MFLAVTVSDTASKNGAIAPPQVLSSPVFHQLLHLLIALRQVLAELRADQRASLWRTVRVGVAGFLSSYRSALLVSEVPLKWAINAVPEKRRLLRITMDLKIRTTSSGEISQFTIARFHGNRLPSVIHI
jgi:hypothetical protein